MMQLPIVVSAPAALGASAPATYPTLVTQARRLIVTCAILLLVVSQAWAGTTTVWVLGPDGRMTRSTLLNSGDDSSMYWDCSFGWLNCGLCAECHRSTTTTTSQRFTAKEHEAVYFPRFQLRVAAGTKVPFGTRGEYLMIDGRSMVKLTADGKKIFTFPPTAVLLKNNAGQPTFVMSASPPTIHRQR